MYAAKRNTTPAKHPTDPTATHLRQLIFSLTNIYYYGNLPSFTPTQSAGISRRFSFLIGSGEKRSMDGSVLPNFICFG
jgi:hypothetical protein